MTVVALATAGCTAPNGGVAVQDAPRIISSAEWGGVSSPVSPQRQTVTRLTVHHQGEQWAPDGDVPAYLRRLQLWSRATKGWSDIPYHYIIGPDGSIYAGRTPSVPGDTNTEYDPGGHVQVMLLGNFEEQVPTTRQWDSAVLLLAFLMKSYDLGPASIGAHRHWSAQTVCPGANLMARFEELRQAAARQAGRR